MRITFSALLLTLVFTGISQAGEVRVAVASNFSATLKVLAEQFEEDSGHTVVISPGSTGRHFAQIMNGAPFDIFLAADTLRPQRLIEAGRAKPGQQFGYARGRLALWTPGRTLSDDPNSWLNETETVALANPRLAPYGFAAEQTLEKLHVARIKRITGENVNQAWQFTASGNVSAGFVALSQLLANDTDRGSFKVIPVELYDPIVQHGVLLNDSAAAEEFVDFLLAVKAQSIIEKSGYLMPEKIIQRGF